MLRAPQKDISAAIGFYDYDDRHDIARQEANIYCNDPIDLSSLWQWRGIAAPIIWGINLHTDFHHVSPFGLEIRQNKKETG